MRKKSWRQKLHARQEQLIIASKLAHYEQRAHRLAPPYVEATMSNADGMNFDHRGMPDEEFQAKVKEVIDLWTLFALHYRRGPHVPTDPINRIRICVR